MQSIVISSSFKNALKRKGIQQKSIAIDAGRSTSTINGYAKGEPVPIQALADIAESMEDSLLSQDFSYMVFKQFPALDSDVFQDNVYSMEIIHQVEASERERYKEKAMIAISKK